MVDAPTQEQLAPGDLEVYFIVEHPNLAGIIDDFSAGAGSGVGEGYVPPSYITDNNGLQKTNLANENFFQSLQYNVLDHGFTGTGTIRVFDPSFSTVESILLFASPTAHLSFGWLNGPTLPFKQVHIISHKVTVEPTGVFIDISFADGFIDSVSRTYNRSFSTPLNPGEIVQQIFSEEGYTKFDIEPTKDIEGEKDKDNITLIQKNVTNVAFVNSRLAPLSISKKGSLVGYKLTILGDTVVYKPSRLLNSTDVVRKYVYARAADSIVKSFSPKLNLVAAAVLGAEELEALSYSPRLKKPVRVPINLESAQYYKGLSSTTSYLIGPSNRIKRQITTPHYNEENIRRFVEDRLYRAREVLVSAELVVMGDPGIAPLDLVEVDMLQPNGKVHYTSGLYQVIRVSHDISGGSFLTNLTLARDGFRDSDIPNKNPLEG